MTTPSPHTDRAARLAAVRAARDAATGGAETPSPPDGANVSSAPPVTATATHRRPARAAKIATVGLSTTAVLGLMTAYGRAEQAAANTAPEPSITGASSVAAPAPGTIRVAADAEAVVLVVDTAGRPVDLVHLPSVADLQAFLDRATPIIPPSTVVAQVASAPVAGDPPSEQSPPASTSATPPMAAPAVSQPAPVVTPPPTPEPADAAPTPAAHPAPVASQPVGAPDTTVPAAQPAPVDLAIPLPAPAGNTAGS